MERLQSRNFKHFKGLTIYHDDIKAIYDILASYDSTVYIISDQYRFDGWNDFETNAKSVKTLQLSIYNSSQHLKVDVNFKNKSFTTLICDYPENPLSSQIYMRIEQVLSSCKRKYAIFFSWQANFAILLVLGVVKLTTLYTHLINKTAENIIASFLLVLVIISVFSNDYSTSIKLIKRQDDIGYFKRNKDDLITSFFTNAISFVVGVIAAHYLKLWSY